VIVDISGASVMGVYRCEMGVENSLDPVVVDDVCRDLLEYLDSS
jgi:hypothetical protein